MESNGDIRMSHSMRRSQDAKCLLLKMLLLSSPVFMSGNFRPLAIQGAEILKYFCVFRRLFSLHRLNNFGGTMVQWLGFLKVTSLSVHSRHTYEATRKQRLAAMRTNIDRLA